VAAFHDVGQPAACLGDDFDVAFDNPAPVKVILKRFEANVPQLVLDVLNGSDNIAQMRFERIVGH
jgi:hypothetical protein